MPEDKPVSALTVFSDAEVRPRYFDEDISDLESDKAAECDCGGEDRDCQHQAEDV
ncbi:hypothetical protein QIS74_00040 [Colletotrichum tabaci]|uniref:Uncharacterized protein n=1 Tax=Colletotrichum tabaci TaxID=1209068 RepID=A0AAV9TU20_9PEZI